MPSVVPALDQSLMLLITPCCDSRKRCCPIQGKIPVTNEWRNLPGKLKFGLAAGGDR